jgi:two-component system, OmpR family, sensor kinase
VLIPEVVTEAPSAAEQPAEQSPSGKALGTLEKLLAMPASTMDVTLAEACDLVAEALNADKVDAFLHDPRRESLVALGSSRQPLSALQRRAGLDVLQVANGGRVVGVFTSGKTFVTGSLQADPEELRGVKETLKIRSKLGVPLVVGGNRRGVLMIASLRPDQFGPADVRFAEMVGHWVGLVAYRAELVEEIARNAVEQGRRAVAEELVTVLAHDLRNYLSPLNLRLNMASRRSRQDGRDADTRDLDLALRTVGRLEALVTDLLDVARIDQGVFQVDPQPQDLGALVGELIKVMSTPEHTISLKVAEEVHVLADGARVRQCVQNLLANAVKHSAQGAPVAVSVSREKREDGAWARVDVIDEGPGIPQELLPRIFDRFVTGQKVGEGLGLGLYLAKRIASAHGGDLAVESAPGKSTRFTLSLPGYLDS